MIRLNLFYTVCCCRGNVIGSSRYRTIDSLVDIHFMWNHCFSSLFLQHFTADTIRQESCKDNSTSHCIFMSLLPCKYVPFANTLVVLRHSNFIRLYFKQSNKKPPESNEKSSALDVSELSDLVFRFLLPKCQCLDDF